MTTAVHNPALWIAEPPVLHDISTVDGWNTYVAHRSDYQAPPLITRAEYDELPAAHRMLYDMAREIAIANLPKHDTPMARAISTEIGPTLRLNTANANPGVRPGIMVSAQAGLGKSTLIREIAAAFDETQRQRAELFPSVAGHRDRWIPVCWVNVPPNVNIKGLCVEILNFYGEGPRTKRESETTLTCRVRDLIAACGTRLLVLDDITRMKMHREADQAAADFVRSLMETGATVLGIGVDVESSGLLSEGGASARDRSLLTQTRRRFTVHRLGHFTDETSDAFDGWMVHLTAVERDLPLLDKVPGMLTNGDTAAYLLRRTGGVIGTLTRLLSEASIRVLAQQPSGAGTGEYLSRAVLDGVTLDHAAQHRQSAADAARQPAADRKPRARNGVFNGNTHHRGVA